MDSAALLSEAFYLIQQDLYLHLEEVEYLAQEEWTDEQVQLVQELLADLCSVITGVLVPHGPDSGGVCPTCEHKWPCSVVILVHGLVKHPQRHFVQLLKSRRGCG